MGRGMYDFDVIVIGGGPAGMAAATRVRWVKTAYAIPASVAVLDPTGLGGLARMGTICLTGPSFSFSGEELAARLAQDITQWEIPVLHEAAVRLKHVDGLWEVHTSQRVLRGLSVVLATGLRQLSDEPAMKAAGRLALLSGGYLRTYERFSQWSREHMDQRLLLIGGASLRESLAEFIWVDEGRNQITCLCEPDARLLCWRDEPDALVIEVEEGGICREARCDAAMIDFHSLEQRPTSLQFLPLSLRDSDGYSAVGSQGQAEYPGLFAAGDCAGAPSLCVKALAQGTEAGFQAYRYVYERKFGYAPPLFAFYVSPERPALGAPELPEIDLTCHRPVGLSLRSRFAGHPLTGYGENRLGSRPLTPEELERLRCEVAEKMATVHLIDQGT